jgi:predicted double-glycine peptidase
MYTVGRLNNMEKLIELAIKEQKEIYEEMREVHTEEDIRLSVYENLLDNLKYYMSDVAYG